MSSVTIPKSHPDSKRIIFTPLKKSIEMLENSIAMIIIVMSQTKSPELGLIERLCDSSD